MKHLKMLGLLAVAAASLMAFAGSASAAVLTSPAGTEYTGELHATLATPNSALLKAGLEETCGESTVLGTVTTNTSTVASGPISKLSFGDCKGTTDVLSSVGSLEVNSKGEVTAKGTEVTVSQFGISCVYGAKTGTLLGTLTEGKPAVLNVSTTKLPKVSGGAFCTEFGTWTAKYTVTTPSELWLN